MSTPRGKTLAVTRVLPEGGGGGVLMCSTNRYCAENLVKWIANQLSECGVRTGPNKDLEYHRAMTTSGVVDQNQHVSLVKRQSVELYNIARHTWRHMQQLIEFVQGTEQLGVTESRTRCIAAVKRRFAKDTIEKLISRAHSCKHRTRHPMGRSQKLKNRVICEADAFLDTVRRGDSETKPQWLESSGTHFQPEEQMCSTCLLYMV